MENSTTPKPKDDIANPLDTLVSGQLCYVDGAWAYFTTQKLEDQWGDDWNDAPYEHNAGTPYADDGFKITKVAFEGNFEQPKDGHLNSPFSVEMINAKQIAWLRTSSWANNKDAISAGASFEEFEMFIKRNGGKVYLSR